ncbi:unnamed protein product [Caenorhabditis brenneri]
MKIKYFLTKNKEGEETTAEKKEKTVGKKEKELTVLSTFLFCVGCAIFILSVFFKNDPQPRTIVGVIGLIFMFIGTISMFRDSYEEDLFKKFFQCFPNRLQKILFSEFPHWKLIFISFFLWFLVFGENGNCLILNVLAEVFHWFIAVFAIVWGYRNTRETDVEFA